LKNLLKTAAFGIGYYLQKNNPVLFRKKIDAFLNILNVQRVVLPLYLENFIDNTDSDTKTPNKNYNIQNQKFEAVDKEQKGEKIEKYILDILNEMFFEGDNLTIQTPSYIVTARKISNEKLTSEFVIHNKMLKIDFNLCALAKNICYNKIFLVLVN
jgi:hypothetical protein